MSAAASVFFTYFVSGHGDFPIDMLRYDCAWPAHEPDAGQVEASFRPNDHRQHRVMLRGKRTPTVARWHSFGWTVGEVEERRS